MFNIEMFDGQRWHGGMNRGTREEALKTTRRWAADTGRRHRVFDPNENLVFDTAAAAADVLAELQRQGVTGDAYNTVAELITELRHAHQIIQLALHHVPASARAPWFLAIDDAGLCGDGVTRFHERQSLLARVGGTTA